MIAGIYYLEFMQFAADYPGFFELLQCLYFVISDGAPLFAFFNMHHQVYGAENAERQNQVQMQVDPDVVRMRRLHEDEMRYGRAYLDVIDQTEEYDRSSRTGSVEESFYVGENFSVQSH